MPEALRRAGRAVPDGFRRPAAVVAATFRLYHEDQCATYAAAIAYYAIFSLVPLALIILSIFGLVVERESIVRFVFDELPLQETQSVRDSVDSIVRRAQQVSPAGLSFGLLALVWSGSGIFAAVRRGLNAASHRDQGRPYWHSKLIDIALIPALGALIILSVGITAVAQVVVEEAGSVGPVDFDTNLAVRVIAYAVPAAISFAMFCLLYRYVPTNPPSWREALAGATLATVLFEAAKDLYATFLTVTPFTRDTAIYAGFGTALVFLFWMFINASILLFGAEFARAVARERAEPVAPPVRLEPVPEPANRQRGAR
jgi:membrane protein